MLPLFLFLEVPLCQSSSSSPGSESGGFFSETNPVLEFIAGVVLILVVGWWSIDTAFAQQVVPRAIYFQVTLPNSGNQLVNSIYRNTVCMARVADYNKTSTLTYVFDFAGGNDSQTSAGCYGKATTGSSVSTQVGTWRRLQCPADKPYFDVIAGECVNENPDPPSNPCSDKNEFIRRWNYGTGPGPFGAPDHFGQCIVTPLEMLVCRKDMAGSYCMWKVKRTGDLWTGNETPGLGGNEAPEVNTDTPGKSPPLTPPPAPGGGSGSCPAGTVQAGSSADGTPVCMGTGTTTPSKPPKPSIDTSKSEQQSDGSTKTTDTKTTTNSDGSTTTNTTVTITKPDGSKETTSGGSTTGSNAAGQPGKEDKPEDDNNLCKQNPNLSICRESSVSGTCGAITCVGDAIQCATLRAAAVMECRQKADEDGLKASPLTAKGNAAISGSDIASDKLPTPASGQTINLPGTGDTSGWLGGGSPFDDVSFSLMGHSIVVPLAKWSGYLIGLRYALMVMASMVSFRILSGTILRS